jgi:SPP1 family predicted phage head-tail adaptor
MRSGNLKHKVEIQSYSQTTNDFGEVTKGYYVFKTVYSSITPISGKEYFASKQVNAEVSHKIEFRFVDGVLPTMRIVYGARVFNIESVINIREENKTLQIMAVEAIDGN